MLSRLVPSFSKLTASTIVGNMTATSKTFDYLGEIQAPSEEDLDRQQLFR